MIAGQKRPAGDAALRREEGLILDLAIESGKLFEVRFPPARQVGEG